MKTEILNIGNELLIGQVVNTNASWMAEQLNLAGFPVQRISVVADNHKEIIAALEETGKRSDLVLITGGLGPTRDDITKSALCEFFDTKLVYSEEVYQNELRLFGSRGLQVTPLNRAQAEVPEKAVLFINRNGTAPGMVFREPTCYIFMPGVPFEMKDMVTEQVIPWLQREFLPQVMVHRTVLTQGMGESFLAAILEPWETQLPEGFSLAYLPQPGIVRLRITGTGADKAAVEGRVAEEVSRMEALIPQYVFGYEDDTLEELVGGLLLEKQATLATAESCTGGYIAHLITSVPGSSRYFKGSVIAYSDDIKERVLGVSAEAIRTHGAVSEAVVKEMAAGVQSHLQADYAIAVSGIAGPDGGTPEKPVGTTWIAIATPAGITTFRYLLGDHRGRNIRRSALQALNLLRKALK